MDLDHHGLLVKYLIDELSEEELGQLLDWKKESKENEEIFTRLVRLRIAQKHETFNKESAVEKAFERLNERIAQQNKQVLKQRPFAKRWIAIGYAALIATLFALSFFGWNTYQRTQGTTILVRSGEQVKRIRLDDGSLVWLKEGTKLDIPYDFSENNRNVRIEGEGYFEIVKNAAAPFHVTAGGLCVKVVGTAFNVKTGATENSVETILVSGKVILGDHKKAEVLDLSPGEKVTYQPNNHQYAVEVVDANILTSWHLQQFILENATLREIVNKLSAKYHVNINIGSKELAEKRYRCVINEDESLEEVLEQLIFLSTIRYRIEGNEIFIYNHKE